MPKQMQPGFVVAVCIARTLHERDPKFLAALKANVVEFQGSQPRGEASWETLQTFYEALRDPEIFSKRS